MKWNDEIRNKDPNCFNEIYDMDKAKKLFDSEKYNHRKLSLMKQENVRMAFKENFRKADIKDTVARKCGYCFKYQCEFCPLYKKNRIECINFLEYEELMKPFAKKKEIALAAPPAPNITAFFPFKE